MKPRQKSQLELDIEAHLGPRERAILDYANAVQDWMQPRYEALWTHDPKDALAVHGWMVETLEAAGAEFGKECPTVMIVQAATGYSAPDDDLSPAYCALQEANRQSDALYRLASRIAHDDVLWNATLGPISEFDVTGTGAIDAALLDLIGTYYGNANATLWRVIDSRHREYLGRPPRIDWVEFAALMA